MDAVHGRSHVEQISDTLRAHMVPAGPLHHLARVADGVADPTFNELDRLVSDGDSPMAPAPRAAEVEPASTRDVLLLLDQRMVAAAADLDRMLQPARSGDLIRLVAQSDRGACFCYPLGPGAFLVGALVTSGQRRPGAHPRGFPEVDVADQKMSTAVATLRSLISLHSQNPGGFEEAARQVTRRHSTRVRVYGAEHHRMLPLCRAALSPDDLHYVGLVERGTLRFAVDVFDDEALAPYFDLVHVAVRRRFHDTFAATLGAVANELGRIVWPLLGSRLARVVFDVEQGAIYFVQITDVTYLVGVTLNQSRVSHADRQLDALATACVDAESNLEADSPVD